MVGTTIKFGLARTILAVVITTLALPARAVESAPVPPLRIAVATDPLTLDPHSVNAGSTTLVIRQIYEPLVGRGQHLEKVPALATEWSNPEPNRWRFRLRDDVRFHDGALFSADDVVFSINRARTGLSDFKLYTSGIAEIRAVDRLTVDVVTRGPDPLLPDKLYRVFIMNHAWAESHGAEQVLDSSKNQGFTTRNANGTGPYRVVRRKPDGLTELSLNPDWWGAAAHRADVKKAEFVPIASDGPRVAALLSGDIDIVVDLPPQLSDRISADKRFRIIEATENRTVFLGMDQSSPKLAQSDVKGTNPFKDRRVRQAVYLAIDPQAIRSGLMQGHSVPTALMWAPSVFGYAAEDDRRPAIDPARARELLSESGYLGGFGVTLTCPNDRYVNDAKICQAVAAQLTRVGIRTDVAVLPFALFVGKIRKFELSFYLLGWAAPTFDALMPLQALVRSRGNGADGSNNFGRYSNPEIDDIIDRIKSEGDPARRFELIRTAGQLLQADIGYIPLHDQTIIWAMRADVEAVQSPENQLDLKWVKFSTR